MAKITFKDVGRGKWCGSIDVENGLSADAIAEAVYPIAKKYLVSKYPDVEYNADTNEGKIYAGYYQVGTFSVS